jgi:hypothetical protein
MKSRYLTILVISLSALLLTACPATPPRTMVPIQITQVLGDSFASLTPLAGRPLHKEMDYAALPPGTVTLNNPDGSQSIVRIVPELLYPEWDAGSFPNSFDTTLVAGHWKKFLLGPAALEQGYLVDVNPKEVSREGAEIVVQVMPEYAGETWLDVLWLLQPIDAQPLPVTVQVYTTAGWEEASREMLYLEPEVWIGYTIGRPSEPGALVVEVNPLSLGRSGDTLQRVVIEPEFYGGWQDALRIQIPPNQAPMQVEVVIYRAPEQLLKTELTQRLQPGEWFTLILGFSEEQSAYGVVATPLSDYGYEVTAYHVQPVFSDGKWFDVLRVRLPAGRQPMEVNLRVYAIGPGSQVETIEKIASTTPDRVATEMASYIIPTYTPDRLATEWAAYLYPTPTPIPPVIIPTATSQAFCPGALPSRLRVGESGMVSLDPLVANRVRQEPDRDAVILGQLMPGEKFTVLEGPRCADGWAWWRVRSRVQDLEGWTSEGDGTTYWLQPVPTPAATRIPKATSTPVISGAGSLSPRAASIPLHLTGDAWSEIFLGETNYPWGYLVDVNPLQPTKDGDHIETYFQTRFDGTQWVDTLIVGLPHPGSSLDVVVDIYLTQDWPLAYRGKMTLPIASAKQFYLADSAQDAAYVIEVNPKGLPESAMTIQPSVVLPEYSDGVWLDGAQLRLEGVKAPLEVEIAAYRAPDLPVWSEFPLHLEPGVWHAAGLAASSEEQAYLVQVNPVTPGREGDHLQRLAVQQEFDGRSWNDVLRMMIPQGQPALDVMVRVYILKP